MSGVTIRGGTVIDGTGRPPRRADVFLRSGRIAAVGDNLARLAGRVVDADGTWVVPGFIDAHSHADLAVLTGEGMEGRAKAGVTTEVLGQDGFALAPVQPDGLESAAESLSTLAGPGAMAHLFPTVEQYLAATRRAGFARVATLLPHGCLRGRLVEDQRRPANPEERARLAAAARAEATDGVLGVSAGLSYPPAHWSDEAELVALLSAMPKQCRRLVIHLRDYGIGFERSLKEAVAVAVRAGARLHLSHFHVSGPGRAGNAGHFLAYLGRVMAAGLSVSMDSYPYDTACTTLVSALPEWFQRKDSATKAAWLGSTSGRRRLAEDLDAHGPGTTFAVGWEGLVLTPRHPEVCSGTNGRSVREAARARGRTAGEIVAEMAMITGLDCFVLAQQGHLDNIRAIASQSNHVVGSDGILAGRNPPHPRAEGSFLRFLSWARDGLLPVGPAEMVAKMTGRTAALLGLPGGTLSEGAVADVLVIDPQRLSQGPDVGQFTPSAVIHSFLGGNPVIRDSSWVGDPRPLRREQ